MRRFFGRGNRKRKPSNGERRKTPPPRARRNAPRSDFTLIRAFLKKKPMDARELLRQSVLNSFAHEPPSHTVKMLARFFTYEQKRTGERMAQFSKINTAIERMQREKKRLLEITVKRRMTLGETVRLGRIQRLLTDTHAFRAQLFEDRRVLALALGKIGEMEHLLEQDTERARRALTHFLHSTRRDPTLERLLREGVV